MYMLGRLAEIIKAELIGDTDATVSRARSFDMAEQGDVTFASNAACLAQIKDCRATAIIVASPLADANCNLLVAPNPKLAFARAVRAIHKKQYEPRGVSFDLVKGEGVVLGSDLSIHSRVAIGRNSIIGNRVTLHPGVVIGDNCHIGDETIIYPNVSIYDECEIGSRVIIHAGAVIGADGFSFIPDEEGRQVKLLQLGRVIIEDDCEIGANCAIDRGFTDTILRRGVKLDNLIQVGHATEIGENTVVASLTGFSGGTRIGRGSVIAGQVGTVEHVSIGDGAIVAGKAVVTKDVRAGAIVGGMIPAQDLNSWRRSQVLYSRLPEMAERLKELERAVRELSQLSRRRE